MLMQSIRKSECPKELESADKRSSVHVNLIKRNEKYPVSLCFQHCIEFRKGSKRPSSDMYPFSSYVH
ncbi:hypothetical protein Godav_005068 [Gossypium davidsonii]|uniref:SEP domain-containing protein n=1 Tax=Gossypium davidsonii TaxID=34287 RepID=A0A7J8SNB9_GOSDV|nr:hypothetical protein [Gossypium davidsonii]